MKKVFLNEKGIESILPRCFGDLKQMTSEQLDEVGNDENGACLLQGTLFQDAELDWCMVSGWGVECGLPIVFYIPIVEIDIANATEHHCSMPEVMTLIRD